MSFCCHFPAHTNIKIQVCCAEVFLEGTRVISEDLEQDNLVKDWNKVLKFKEKSFVLGKKILLKSFTQRHIGQFWTLMVRFSLVSCSSAAPALFCAQACFSNLHLCKCYFNNQTNFFHFPPRFLISFFFLKPQIFQNKTVHRRGKYNNSRSDSGLLCWQ